MTDSFWTLVNEALPDDNESVLLLVEGYFPGRGPINMLPCKMVFDGFFARSRGWYISFEPLAHGFSVIAWAKRPEDPVKKEDATTSA
jgi:hypothetical protein